MGKQDFMIKPEIAVKKIGLKRPQEIEEGISGSAINDDLHMITEGCIGDNKLQQKEEDELSYHLNRFGESAIYLAAKPGLVGCVSSILALRTDERRLNELFKNKLQQKEEDEHVTAEMYKDPDLYLAAMNGDLHHFKRILDRISTGDDEDILYRLSPAGNTFLHVAAKHGNQDIVIFIACMEMEPSLVLAKNLNGETALHLAAKGGDEPMVKALVGILSHNEREKRHLLMAENEMGNTALHEALLSGWESVSSFFIQQDPELSYHLNRLGESAIYLAAKAGLVGCVSSILALCMDERRLNELFKNKYPIQAAIERKDRDVLEAMFKANPRLIQMRDGKGRNPLHFAASLGHLEETRYLLKKCALNATQKDNHGALPIHRAASEGHVHIISLLLQDFSDAGELLDRDGCNILHVASAAGRYDVVSFVLKNPNLDSLINMKDKSGMTPLHWACAKYHPKIVSTLTWDQRVDIKAVNNKGMTALDVAEAEPHMPVNPQFRQRLTWAALKAASVPRHFSCRKDSSRNMNVNSDFYKERVNTLLVVATLVATVTFAAGFTMPGGYISSETGTDLGMATMWRDTGFHVFVLCDTIAMYSSIVVVTALIWAQLGDITLALIALKLAAPLLGVALIMMSMAFTSGVIIVVTKLRWLQIALLAMGISFVAFLLLLLLPLCAPLTSRSRMLRYISYYPFCLLILVSSTKPNPQV